MVFMTGFVLIDPSYREGEKRDEVKRFLSDIGFEVYETNASPYLVYYVEANTVKELDDLSKLATSHPGVLKVYVSYGYLGDDEKLERLEEALEKGEIAVGESVIEYLRELIEDLKGE